MQATISSNRFDSRGFIVVALAVGLLLALTIAAAIATRSNESAAVTSAAPAIVNPVADVRFIEENLYLPTGRIAVQSPGYADYQFAEQILTLPGGAFTAPARSYAAMQELELNLHLPLMTSSAADLATQALIEANSWGATFVFPTTAPAADLATRALIEQNSWGTTFFTALPEPGTLPRAHDEAFSY